MVELNKIYCCDCLEFLSFIDSNIIDLTITSPPYDGLRKYNGYTLDFENTIKELYRVTKDGGIVVWIVADETKNWSESCSSFRQALYFKEVGFNLHDTMIWVKSNPMPQKNWKRYTNVFEYMFIFSKGIPKTCNYIFEECKTKGTKYTKNNFKNSGEGYRITKNGSVGEYKIKGNVWSYSVSQFKGHPATFPLDLAKDHILSWSNKGDLVLDIMCGSGTSLLSAKMLDRNYIGCDISEQYVTIAKNRLNGI
ncbi:MAG: DNA-methyltransferase [Cetobacterium sp.]